MGHRKNERRFSVSPVVAFISLIVITSATAANGSNNLERRRGGQTAEIIQTSPSSLVIGDSATGSIQCTNASPSSLFYASKIGNLADVQRMIACGEDPNAQAHWAQILPGSHDVMELQAPPIHAAAWNGHLEVVQTLIDAGADVNALDEWGFSVLMSAAEVGDASMVSLLINADADVNTVTTCEECYQETALTIAAEFGHAIVVHRLLAAGADETHMTAAGLTALGLAQREGHAQAICVLEVTELSSSNIQRCF